ncbi:long-chain fatty acid--CoA ligase [Acidocella sp.]|uniref:long-chain-fatty-acid--CoA ligase n=1 Tax=Acidocella sp. TaxID=50710 RepID=UPI0026252320|nr:long-chain fatty acid--CoA ligase [Acidocella sp.]
MIETIAPGFRPTPVATLLDEAVSRFARHKAVDFLGRRYSYAEIGHLTARAAAGLQALGVGKGTKVGLCLPNTPYAVVMYFAVLKTGATVLNFNPLYTAHEMEHMLRDTGCKMLVTIDAAPVFETVRTLAGKGLLERVVVCSLAAALPALKGLALRLFKPGALAKIPATAPYLRFEALLAAARAPFRPVEIDPSRDVAVLQFTGGTTGTPKAAMLSHANVTVNVHQVQAILPPLELGAERFLGILPFFHVFAMTAVMNLGLAIGAELILLPKPEIGEIMKTLFARKPTIVPGVPTLFTAISNAAEAAGRTDLSFIKFCVSGGAPLSVEVMERFERISKSRILEGYGLSETAPALTFSRPGMIKHGSVGPAIPGTEIQIRDPANPEIVLPQGARGEICARGPQVMLGYYNQPEETAYAFTDGFFRTGDIGYLDEDGCLFIVDRIKDLIICSGFNVYPRVIEEAAYQHPAVAEAIAVGIPDPYRGQAPKLYVTLRPGFETATGEEILDFLKDKLNKIEMPKKVEIRATLPKTMVGKLSKKELLAEEAEQARKP